jgi:hypothetical protein
MKNFISILASCLLFSIANPSAAQNPNEVLRLAAASSQVGNPTPFGQQLRQVIGGQTGGTGIYPALIQLGPILGTYTFAQFPLPGGQIIQGRVFHVGGYSDWELGLSATTGLIEYSRFIPQSYQWGAPPNVPNQTAPQPGQPTQTVPGPAPTITPPTSQSDGCSKYPSLC